PSYFTTGQGTATVPTVVKVSPPNGATAVPVNPQVVVQMSAAVNPLSVGSNAISLSAAGVPVPGSITVSSDASTLTFTPGGLLSPSTAYSVSASGFADQAGNQVMPFTSGFTTGTSGVANTLSPAVI